MNLLVDEGVDRHIVERLRQDGHQVTYMAESGPGLSDIKVLERANEASAILLTADKDFGEMVFQEGRLNSGGVVLIRLAGLSANQKSEIISDAFRARGTDFANSFSVVSAGKNQSSQSSRLFVITTLFSYLQQEHVHWESLPILVAALRDAAGSSESWA